MIFVYYNNVLTQLIYNLNSRWAYADRIPIWETGKVKGPKAAKAYKEAKAEFKTKLKEKSGLCIGKIITSTLRREFLSLPDSSKCSNFM